MYGEPATALRLIGVTGTQGKTTTTRLAEGGLQQAGVPAAVIGTVGTRVAGADVKTALTTPEAPDLHGLFAVMRERGVAACAMEVSSHALVMGRVDGVVFDVAVFTNLGRDHLDFHADVEDYFAAKASLFTPERARLGLVNVDDEHGRRLVERGQRSRCAPSPPTGARRRLAGGRRRADGRDGSRVHRRRPGRRAVPRPACPLPGDFNVANALAAVAACAEAGFDAGAGRRRHRRRRRRARAGSSGSTPARTSSSSSTTPTSPTPSRPPLRTLRPLTDGRLIVVHRRRRRPRPGQAAADGRDRRPAGRRPRRHRRQPAHRGPGRDPGRDARRRRRRPAPRCSRSATGAPRSARPLRRARPGDIVLVAGKGHETGQEVAGVVHPFDDRDVVREALRATSG